MSELTSIFIKEILDALDEIQITVPAILEYYYDSQSSHHNSADNDEIQLLDIDLLAMNILNVRDSAKSLYPICQTAAGLESTENTNVLAAQSYDFNNSSIKSIGLALMFHIHMLTDPDSIYNSDIINNSWPSNINICAGAVGIDGAGPGG